jgi:4'-phosphopantetheinyl transferase EntD
MMAAQAIAQERQPGRAEADLLRAIFPPDCAVVVSTNEGDPADLFACEAAYIRNAIPSRQAEFAAGRACVRQALRDLGAPRYAIPADSQRAPVWPTGIVGSISHCPSRCAAVVGHRPFRNAIGLDVETRDPLKDELRPVVTTPAERAALARLRGRFPCDPYKLLFVAKEALFKLTFPMTRRFLEFHDAIIRLNLDGTFEAEIDAAMRFAGRYGVTDGLIIAGMVA